MSSQPPAISIVRTSPVGENLRVAQAVAGVSNVQIARACGVTEKTVSRWRAGADIRWDQLVKIAALLKRDPEWFYVRRELGEAA